MARLRAILLTITLLFAAPSRASINEWRPLIAEASARFGVPQAWIERVMRAESFGNPKSLSPKGAMGLMQLMPGTWIEMRSTLGLGPDPYDPRDNIYAGTFYLRRMYQWFGYPGLFAAYNAGPRRYGDYLIRKQALPPETRGYVAFVGGDDPAAAVSSPIKPAEASAASLFFPLSPADR